MKENITILQRELNSVQDQITALEKAMDTKFDYGLGEGDPSITHQEIDRALLEHLKERAETLRRAIAGIGQGTYGICAQCGNPIHADRLAVLPDTRICVHCAQANQRRLRVEL
jgi:RNA polymerase-binding transcription factor DksA